MTARDGATLPGQRPIRELKDVIHVTFARAWRTFTVNHGLSRSSTDTTRRRWPPSCICIRRFGRAPWMQGRAESPKVPAERQWHRQTQITITVPARNQETAHHPRGMFPASSAIGQGLGPLQPPAHAGQARAHSYRPTVGAIACPRSRQGFREESIVAWSYRKENHHGQAVVLVGSAS